MVRQRSRSLWQVKGQGCHNSCPHYNYHILSDFNNIWHVHLQRQDDVSWTRIMLLCRRSRSLWQVKGQGCHNLCPRHNLAIFRAISIIFGMCIHNDKTMCREQESRWYVKGQGHCDRFKVMTVYMLIIWFRRIAVPLVLRSHTHIHVLYNYIW